MVSNVDLSVLLLQLAEGNLLCSTSSLVLPEYSAFTLSSEWMERFKLTWKKTQMILVSFLKQGVLLQPLVAEKSSSNSYKHFICQNFHR